MTRPSREQLALQEALPAYEVVGELGRGAFGVVYAARHSQLGREVAIKQLPRAFAADPAVRERFVAEAQMVASLDHPHIVPVYDFLDRDDGICLLIMERCQGSLSDRFQDEGLATDEACAAVLAACAALDYAHGAALLHRDIKPENLLYDTKGVVKLGDFGIARALDTDARRTATGMVIGTPAYMSPEQVRGETLTPSSDVYSVGIMAYELLSGGLPFPGSSTTTGLLAHHLVTPPIPLVTSRPELPAAVGRVIDGALVKDPQDRYPSALEFATDLTQACVGAFGAGWLRRRRFVLHWPEIIAVAERPDERTVRTGTIIVKADQHRDQIVDPSSPELPAPPSTTPPGGLIPPPGGTVPAPVPADTRSRLPVLIGAGAAAVVIALAIGVLALRGGDDARPDEPSLIAAAEDVGQATAVPDNTASPATTSPSSSDTLVSGGGSPTNTPAVQSLSTRPADLDMTVVDSTRTTTPCPDGPERVACIFAGVAVDTETGELTVPYFTEGYVPELEPADHHIHFYLDSAVAGDERKAGNEVPGGSWKEWDGPSPFTSFGGDSGRTGFTMADVEAAGATRLCALVADSSHRVVPGTGNCAPLAQIADPEVYDQQVNRLNGTYVGSCQLGATLIVPDGWRAVDLVTTPLDDAARLIRPTEVDQMRQELDELTAAGGVLWADGPASDGSLLELNVSKIPGNFTAADTPDAVGATLAQLGIDTTGSSSIGLMGRSTLTTTFDAETGRRGRSYVIADFDYALVVTVTGPATDAWNETSDAIAATIGGC